MPLQRRNFITLKKLCILLVLQDLHRTNICRIMLCQCKKSRHEIEQWKQQWGIQVMTSQCNAYKIYTPSNVKLNRIKLMQKIERLFLQMIHALCLNVLTDNVQIIIICDKGSAEDISNLTHIPHKMRPLLFLVSGCL